MPRKARIDAPGALHHLILRGIERKRIFQDDTDRNNFLDRLGDILKDTAEYAGVDMNRFLIDFNDPAILDRLVEDHFHAVNDLKIFGTPTFVFNGKNPVFLKIDLSDIENSFDLFKEFFHIAKKRKNVLEIKRP